MRPADGLLLLAALLVEATLIFRFWQPPQAGSTAIIETPTERLEIALDRDQRLVVNGALGPSVLAIEDGAIRFVESPCRRKVCIRSGAHRHAGASMACVPNRISVSVSGANEEGFDAIHF